MILSQFFTKKESFYLEKTVGTLYLCVTMSCLGGVFILTFFSFDFSGSCRYFYPLFIRKLPCLSSAKLVNKQAESCFLI